MGQDDLAVKRLPRATVLDIVKATSSPLLMYPVQKPLTAVSSPAQVAEQEQIERRNAEAHRLNGKRERTMVPSWDRLFAESCEAVNHNFFLSSLVRSSALLQLIAHWTSLKSVLFRPTVLSAQPGGCRFVPA